jgi:hypothetical protein
MLRLPSELDGIDVMATQWTGFRWPVYRVTIISGVWDPDVGNYVPPKEHPLRQFMPRIIPPSGIFFPEGATVHPVAKSVLVVPVEGRHEYNPMAVMEDFLQKSIKVDFTSPEALIAFVNRWGRLGVGLHWRSWRPGFGTEHTPIEPGEKILDLYRRATDSVDATAEALHSLQRGVRWLRAIQNREWDRSGIPELEQVRVWAESQIALYGVEEKLPEKPSRRLHMLAFASWITHYLEGVHPTIRWDPDAGSVPAWVVRSPIEALWVTLWDWATRGGRLRRCRRCKHDFLAEHASKRFCSHECAAKASAARWYRTKGKKLRKQSRQSKLRKR